MATPARITDDNLPVVALIGRVNVGKSSLFNKIIEERLAIVSDIPGTTRTRNTAVATWRGIKFRLVDTGGLTFSDDVPLEDDIVKQTEIAIKESDVIVFVTDVQSGLLPQEKAIGKLLRAKAAKKPIIFVANKADNLHLRNATLEPEWLKLALGAPLAISADSGTNLGDLLDLIYTKLGKKAGRKPTTIAEHNPIKVALMGKPNVGKSSLFNKLVGEDRVIVSDIPHTTREPHDVLVEFDSETSGEKKYVLFIDTAGIRRKNKVSGELEKIGIGKSLATIQRSDIVLLVLDATEPISDQDQQLGGLLREHTRSVIIIVNKWDEAEDNADSFRNDVKLSIYNALPHLKFAPIVFTSAKTGYRIQQIFPLIEQAWAGRQVIVDDVTLKDFLKRMTKKHLPTRDKGVRHPRLVALTQLGTNPPMFDIVVKANTSLHISYVHFLENQLRTEFGFFASPIIMKLSKLKKFTDPNRYGQ